MTQEGKSGKKIDWTHFVAVPVSDPEVLDSIDKFLSGFFGKFKNSELQKARVPKKKYHLTLMMLQIPEGCEDVAIEIFKKAVLNLAGEFQGSSVHLFDACIKGVGVKKIIHTDVDCNGNKRKLKLLMRAIGAGFRSPETTHCQFKVRDNKLDMHCTILDSSLIHKDNHYSIQNNEFKYLKSVESQDFGMQKLNSVQLLRRAAPKQNIDPDEYFDILSEVKFDN